MESLTTAMLIRSNSESWRLSVENPFLEALAGGHVPPAIIEKFVRQCLFFADAAFTANALVLSKAPVPARSVLLDLLAETHENGEWVRRLVEGSASAQHSLHPISRGYGDFLTRQAVDGFVPGVTALWGFYRAVVDDWGARREGADSALREFTERFASPRRKRNVAKLEPLLDAAYAEASASQRAAAAAAFEQVAHYTLDFWVMSLEPEAA